MSLRIIKRNPSGQDKEVLLEIDPVGSGSPQEQTYSVKGRVVDANDQPQVNKQVVAYDKGLTDSDLTQLGPVEVINSEGNYLIYYTTDLLNGKLYADLLLKVFDEGADVATAEPIAESDIYVDALPDEEINITTVDEEDYLGPSEYSVIAGELTNYVPLGFDIQSMTLDSIEILAAKIDRPTVVVADFLKARDFHETYFDTVPAVTEEVLYGLLRFDLPYDYVEFLDVPEEDKREALEAVTESNIINPTIIDNLSGILASLQEAVLDNGLIDDETQGPSYVAQLLKIVGIEDPVKLKDFYRYYKEVGQEQSFWTRLVTDGKLLQEESDNAKFIFSLSVVTQSHLPMVQNLWEDPTINSLEDLGSLELNDWLAKINADGAGVPFAPAPYNSAEDTEYAEALIETIDQLYSSRVLDKEIDAELVVNPTADYNKTKALINSTVAYDIKEDSPRRKNFENGGSYGDSGMEEVYRTRRLFHLFGKRNRISRIEEFNNNGLRSATDITRRSKRRFIKDQSELLGGNKEAEKVYRRAYKRKAAALMLHSQYNPSLNTVNTSVNPLLPLPDLYEDLPSSTQSEEGTKEQLKVFFGSLDYCECEHCQSSISPAAYLVDLLEFLKEAENKAVPSQSPWAILKLRRPDIPQLELTCNNTNTVMPYIDLVNEVLETIVNPGAAVSRQTTLASDSLRVMPEHLDKEAYNTLASQVYPWILPFNLWNEEAHSYLHQQDIRREEVVRAFQGNTGQPTGMTIEEASVLLNISTKMKDDVLFAPSFTQFYGQTNTAGLQKVSDLLDIAGLSYEELLSLVETTFVNPTNIEISFSPSSSCSVSDATLAFTSGQYRDLHKFSRLTKILNWEIDQLDCVLSALGAGSINDTVLKQLAGIQKLNRRFRIPVKELAYWFGSITTKAYGNDKSEFEKIFLNPAYNSDPTVRAVFQSVIELTPTPVELVSSTGVLNQENVAVVTAALGIPTKDVLRLVNLAIADPSAVTFEDLSYLYRVASFSRALKISVLEYLDLKRVMGISPISEVEASKDPDDAIAFLLWHDLLKAHKISVSDLNFLLQNDFLSFQESAEENRASSIDLIRSALIGKVSSLGVTISRQTNDLLNLFLLFFNEQVAINALEIVKETPSSSEDITAAAQFLDDHWADLVGGFSDNLATIKDKLITGSAGVLIEPLDARIDYVFRVFHQELVNTLLLENEVAQKISDDFDASLAEVSVLLTTIPNPENASSKIIDLFTNYDFIYSDDPINDSNHRNQLDVLLVLRKVSLVIEKLAIQNEQIAFVLESVTQTGWFDLTSFPTPADASPTWNFGQFIRLAQAFDLERRFVSGTFSMVNLIKRAVEASTDISTELKIDLSNGVGWNREDIEYVCNIAGFITDYTDELWLIKLEGILSQAEHLAVSAEQLFSLKGIDVTYDQAQSIRASVRSNYSESNWEKVGADVRDRLRIKQRDALTEYIIANDENHSSSDDLYSHFLIDTEMAPCAMTSRIKLASSTAQLWVQRIRMDLEPGITFNDEDMDEWDWRKNYRVWEAARKVFLYPENWIEPELREDKTAFFKALEDELIQDDVNAENVERAYLNYLKNLDEVAQLEIVATTQQEDEDILHVFARTKNEPPAYFYRKLLDGITWTDWEPVDLEIQGNHLVPVIFNRRLMLFWPIFKDNPERIKEDQLSYDTSSQDNVKGSNPAISAEFQLAYSEWSNNKWQPRKVSQSAISSEFGLELSQYFFKCVEESDGLYIDCYYQEGIHVGSFYLNNCTGVIKAFTESRGSSPTNSVINTYRDFQQLQSKGARALQITDEVQVDYNIISETDLRILTNTNTLFNAIPSTFKLTYPISELEILPETPFFFEDENRSFFITTTEERFNKGFDVDLRPEPFYRYEKRFRSKRLSRKKTIPNPRYVPRVVPKVSLNKQPVNLFRPPTKQKITFRNIRKSNLLYPRTTRTTSPRVRSNASLLTNKRLKF